MWVGWGRAGGQRFLWWREHPPGGWSWEPRVPSAAWPGLAVPSQGSPSPLRPPPLPRPRDTRSPCRRQIPAAGPRQPGPAALGPYLAKSYNLQPETPERVEEDLPGVGGTGAGRREETGESPGAEEEGGPFCRRHSLADGGGPRGLGRFGDGRRAVPATLERPCAAGPESGGGRARLPC